MCDSHLVIRCGERWRQLRITEQDERLCQSGLQLDVGSGRQMLLHRNSGDGRGQRWWRDCCDALDAEGFGTERRPPALSGIIAFALLELQHLHHALVGLDCSLSHEWFEVEMLGCRRIVSHD